MDLAFEMIAYPFAVLGSAALSFYAGYYLTGLRSKYKLMSNSEITAVENKPVKLPNYALF